MSTEDYFIRKQKINSNKELTDRQKEVLITELRHERFGIDRSSFGHMDSVNFKSAIIKVM